MMGETNSMVGYHLVAEDHSIQLGIWGGVGGGALWAPLQVQGRALVGVKIFENVFEYKL